MSTERGFSQSGAARAHLHLAEAAMVESEPVSLSRRVIALAFALVYLIAMPLLLAQNAVADDGHGGENGSAVVKGSSGPGGSPDDEDEPDDRAGASVEDNDDGTKDPGTSARGQETLATTGGVHSTNNRDGDNTDGHRDAGTSVPGAETVGTTCGQQSTGNRDGDNTDGGADNGTSAKGNESVGTTGGQDSSWAPSNY